MPNHHPAPNRPVITGMGICTPLARTLDDLWEAIRQGRKELHPPRHYDASALPDTVVADFAADDTGFAVPAPERAWRDRGEWFLLTAAHAAIAQAGLRPQDLDGRRVAVAVGSQHVGMERFEELFQAYAAGTLDRADPRKTAACLPAHATAAVGALLGARGPHISICAACAASTTALGLAFDLISSGSADLVAAAGTDTLSYALYAGFHGLRALSPVAIAPFSDPPGVNLAEGAGVLIVESLEHARRRGAVPLAEILGYGLSGDGYHITNIDPSGAGIEAATREALRVAGVAPAEVDYIDAHGTGTDANDRCESHTLLRIFGDRVPVSSPKSHLGHTLGASGIIEIIVALVCQARGVLPPTINFTGRRETCAELDYVPNAPRPKDFNIFLNNNYGFGGSNASVVIARSGEGRRRPACLDETPAITGLGAVSAAGESLAKLLDHLWTGRSAVRYEEGVGFEGRVRNFHLHGEQLRPYVRMPPGIQYALAAVQEALAGNEELAAEPARCGLIGSVDVPPPRAIDRFFRSVFLSNPRYASARDFPLTQINAPTGQVSIAFGLKGYTTTFCGFSPLGLGYAADLVRQGRQRAMVAFGADELSEFTTGLHELAGSLRHQQAHPFDGMDGVNLGEGAVAVVIEPLSAARRRNRPVLARLLGMAAAQDPHLREGRTADVVATLRAALVQAGLEPGDIGGVMAMGTGPAYWQKVEMAALHEVFGATLPPTATTVGLTGFCPAATPIFNIAAAVQALGRGTMPLPPHRLLQGKAAEGKGGAARPLRHVLVLCHSRFDDIAALVLSGDSP